MSLKMPRIIHDEKNINQDIIDPLPNDKRYLLPIPEAQQGL